MGIDDILKDKREEIRQIAARHGAHNLRVFGSVARGEADEHSDIDFLVEMEPGRSLLDLGSLMIDLKALLGRTVDIVCEDSIYWLLRRRILKEAQPL
ncbi:MAG TPA: nucleotidyltransferase family protein [Deltaproteobacteria bacterium]|nr:nucleotidyltransferase family protein [Deltaproteobacteria bacterium]